MPKPTSSSAWGKKSEATKQTTSSSTWNPKSSTTKQSGGAVDIGSVSRNSVQWNVERAYKSLTDKERQLVDYEMQWNPDKFSNPSASGSYKDDPLYNSSMVVKGLDASIPDDWQKQIPKKNGIYNAIDSDGSINEIWQRAYDNMGVLQPFLSINTTGTPQEQKNASADSLQNLAYRRYKQLQAQYEDEAEVASWANRVYQRDGVVDEAATRAFQELSTDEKRIVNSFGSDGKPSAVSTREDMEVYQKFQALQDKYRAEGATSAGSSQVFVNSDGTVDEGKTRAFQGLSASEQAVITKFGKNGYPSGLVDAGDLVVYNKFKAETDRYNRELAGDYLSQMQSGTKYANATTVSGGSSAVNIRLLSSDQKKDVAKQFNLDVSDIESLIDDITSGSIPVYRRERVRASLGANNDPATWSKATRLPSVQDVAENIAKTTAQGFAQAVRSSVARGAEPAVEYSQTEVADAIVNAVKKGQLIGDTTSQERGLTAARAIESLGYGAENTASGLVGGIVDAYNAAAALMYNQLANWTSTKVTPLSAVSDPAFVTAAKAGVTKLLGGNENPVSEFFRDARDQMMEGSFVDEWNKGINERYANVSDAQKTVANYEQQIARMLPRIGLASATAGASESLGISEFAAEMIPKYYTLFSAAGTGMRDKTSDDTDKTFAYGLYSGASEALIEELLGGIQLGGAGALDDVVHKTIEKVTSNPLVQSALFTGASVLGESIEEAISAVVDPLIRRTTVDPNAPLASAKEILQQALEGGAVALAFEAMFGVATGAVNLSFGTESRNAAINSVSQIINENSDANFDPEQFWSSEKIESLRDFVADAQTTPDNTQVHVPAERYDALVNSRKELTTAQAAFDNISNEFTQALASGQRLGTNVIRQYQGNVKAAADKLAQTRQAMTAAEVNFNNALNDAQASAWTAIQNVQQQQAQAEAQAEQEQTELQGLYASSVLTPEQVAAWTNVADVNKALSQADIDAMLDSEVAPWEAEDMQHWYSELEMERARQTREGAASDTSYLEYRLDQARDAFVQAAQTEIQQRGAQALGTTNVESARRITENRAANGIAPQSPADVETAQRNAVMQAPARATTEQLNAAVDAVVADPEATRDNPMAQRQVTEAANELANREAQEQWANAKPEENIEGTYVDQDGVRRSVATDSYLRYNVAMPDDSRRGRTLRNRDTLSREFAAAFESYISVGNDPDIQESGATELAYDRSGLIKLKDYGDFQSVIHGVGHRVAELYGITDVLGVDNVWQQFPEAIQAQYNNDQDVLRGEAYAEAFKMYIYNPDYARQFWPEYVQLVEQNMTRRQRRAVREMSRAVRADNAASFGEKVDNTQTDKRTSENLVRRLAKSMLTREGHNQFIQQVFDPEIGLDELGQAAQRNLARAGEGGIERGAALPYQRANYNLGSNARANSVLYGIGTVDWDADGGPVRADVSLAEVMAPVVAKGEETQNLFYRYLKLVSAVDDERMGYAVFPKDITLDAQEQEIADLKKNNPEFVKVADDLFKWHHNYMFVRGVKTGLTSQASYNDMVEKRPHYLPFNRDIESNPSGSVGVNKDIGPITGVRFGSRANTFNPIQQIAAQVYAIEALNDKVALRRQIYDIITNVPGMAIYASEVDGNQTLEHTTNDPAGDPDTWWYSQPSLFMDGNKLAVRLDSGQMKYLEIHDPALLAYFTDAASVAASKQEFDNLLKQGAEVVQTANRIAAGLLTVHKPTFAVTNAERDYPTAWAKSTQPIWQLPQFIGRQLASIVENTAKLSSDIIGDNATEKLGNLATKALGKVLGEEKAASFNDFMGWTETPVGGTLSMMELYMATGMGQTELRGNINEPKNARAIMRRISPTKIDKVIAKGLDIWDALPTVGERSPRYAEFAYAMKQSGGDYVYAMNEANRVTTDFRKGGKAVRAVKKWWLFAGANMNGLYQDWRILSGREYRNPDGTRDKGAQWNYIAKATSFTFLMSLASALSWKAIRKKYGNDDEEFIPDYVDDNSFTFAYDADGHYVKWRVPQSVYFAMNREVWELAYRAANDPSFDPPAAIEDMIADIASAASPVGDLGGPGEANPLGSSFLGASEINTFYLNKKWTNADIDYSWETTGKNATSPELHVGKHTTELAKWLGNATGLSPKQWDVELEQRGSYLYDMYGMLTDKEGLIEGFKNYIGDIFVGNALYSTDVFNNVYNERDKIQVILNDIEESGSSPKYKRHLSEEDIMNANDEAEGLYQILDDAAGEMSDIRSEIAQLQADGAPEERILARQREMAIIAAEALYQTGLYKSNYLRLRER